MRCTAGQTLVFLLTLAGASALCDRNSGPSGTVECITIPRYNNERQWATCLTDAYIQSKSRGRHQCEDRTTTYCYYQCMLEVLGEENGPVAPQCACGDEEHSTTTACPAAQVDLPDRCFSPDGTDCDWYRDCLEARFQCSSTGDDYGIAYAEKYCRLYEDSYHSFSPLGQRWIDAARKCLQVELVPLLRPFECPTCKDIKTRAFRSHSGCYVTPQQGAPSVCSLPALDFWRIFWTIKSAFTSEFVESVFGMYEVLTSCTASAARGAVDYMKKLTIEVILPKILRFAKSLRGKRSLAEEHNPLLTDRLNRHAQETEDVSYAAYGDAGKDAEASYAGYSDALGSKARSSRRKRSPANNSTWRGESSEQLHYHQTAADIARQLAAQLGWQALDIQWFAYGVYNNDDEKLTVNVLVADQALNASSPSSVNVTGVVQRAAAAYEEGKVRFTVSGTPLPAGQLLGCLDQDCQHAFVNATAPNAAVSMVQSPWLMMVVSTTAAALLTRGALLWG